MRSDQLCLLTSVGTPAVHPSGTWAVVALTRPDFRSDDETGQLWRVDLTGEAAPRRLTRGFADGDPAFSTDGEMLLFLRREQEGRPQVVAMPAAGGEVTVLTDAARGVGSFAISPDSSTLAYIARVPEEGRYGTLDGVDAAAEDPRHITTLQFHANGLGYTAGQRKQLFVVDIPALDAEPPIRAVGRAARDERDEPVPLVPVARRLVELDADVDAPVFTRDGTGILVVAALHEGADAELVTDVYEVPVAGGTPRRVTDGTLSIDVVTPGDDGLFLLASEVGSSKRDFVGRNPGVWHLAAGEQRPRRLTEAEPYHLSAKLARWRGGVLAIEDHRGSSRLHHVTVDADTILADGPLMHAVATTDGDDAVVLSVATTTSPGELASWRDGDVALLTDWAAGLRAATSIVEPEEFTATAADGHPIHGWVLTPSGEGPHPVLLAIHGGPFSRYTASFFDEFQVYVDAGYAVVACNPRGSSGYGEAHGRAIRGDMGNLDFTDVLTFFEAAVAAHPALDQTRAGVMGGSYGGYLTAWIIGHDHRFAGAIVERGFLDPATFTGASDIGWFFQHEYNGSERAVMDAQSPMSFVDHVTTPTLVIHSEQDLRCPIAQGYRYYTELKLRGVKAELLAFPGENHELTRSGTPWHRRQRFDAILRWWNEKLPLSKS